MRIITSKSGKAGAVVTPEPHDSGLAFFDFLKETGNKKDEWKIASDCSEAQAGFVTLFVKVQLDEEERIEA